MKRQNVLYLFCSNASLQSSVQGMSIFENGVLSDGSANAKEWPYQTVAAAINDGWRVVQFPQPGVSSPDDRQRYVPCEFILEKIVEVDA